MCGVAGTIERSIHFAPVLKEIAGTMIEPMVHRGPDASGIWTDPDAGVGLGHRRLSIVDLSPAGAQPMVSSSGRFVVSYNGEIYNAAELRSELEAHGIRFHSHSDTEVLLEACATLGVERATNRLIGMFVFAMWDRKHQCLYLARDRMGIKPMYYQPSPQRFLFSSELSGLRSHPNFEPQINPEAVDAFLTLDYIPAPMSIYMGVNKLESGTILRVDRSSLSTVYTTTYWSLAKAAQQGFDRRYHGTMHDAAEELHEILTDAVTRRMIADVPLGAFLSGGIDSSTVVALMQQQSSRPVKTFTIGFEEKGFDEAPYSRAVASHLGTEHCEHYISDDEIRRHGPSIISKHDEPFADPSLLPTFFLSQLARSEVIVALSGDGGDELFGGYPRHMAAERILSHPAFGYRSVAKGLLGALVPLVPRKMRGLVVGTTRLESDLRMALSPAEAKILARCLRFPHLIHHCLSHGSIRNTSNGIEGPEEVMNMINDWLEQCKGMSPAERQQYIDASSYLPDNILTKVDRASMSVSLEVRVPLLDHRIVELSFRLPSTFKANATTTKSILRKILSQYVPQSMFDRPKMGFGPPMRSWLNGPLQDWVGDLMTTDRVLQHEAMNTCISQKTRLSTKGQYRFREIALAAWCGTNA